MDVIKPAVMPHSTPHNVIDWASGANGADVTFYGVEGKRYRNDLEYRKAFHVKFITSSEIAEQLAVPKATVVYARKRGQLPDSQYLPGVKPIVWEREPLIPYLLSWELSLKSRRGQL